MEDMENRSPKVTDVLRLSQLAECSLLKEVQWVIGPRATILNKVRFIKRKLSRLLRTFRDKLLPGDATFFMTFLICLLLGNPFKYLKFVFFISSVDCRDPNSAGNVTYNSTCRRP